MLGARAGLSTLGAWAGCSALVDPVSASVFGARKGSSSGLPAGLSRSGLLLSIFFFDLVDCPLILTASDLRLSGVGSGFPNDFADRTESGLLSFKIGDSLLA